MREPARVKRRRVPQATRNCASSRRKRKKRQPEKIGSVRFAAPDDRRGMETTNSPALCAHDWQPIDGWYARYRCARCHVIGCKFGVVQAKHVTRSNEIQPYRCEVRRGGERCNAPAVSSSWGKKFRCAEHRHAPIPRPLRHGPVATPAAAPAAPAAVASEDTATPRIAEPSTESR